MEYLQFLEHLAICKGKKGINEYFDDPDVENKEDIMILYFNNDFDIFMENDLFDGCFGLKSLELVSCQIKVINFELFKYKSMPSLEKLRVHINPLKYIDINESNYLPKLKYLNLAQSLKTEDFEIYCNCLLEELVLSHNSIKEIKIQNIFNTDTLKIIDFSENQITTIKSNTFTKLPNLISLNLSFNQISKIEDNAFEGLYNLQEMNLAGKNNKIIYRPYLFKTISGLSKLKYLTLNKEFAFSSEKEDDNNNNKHNYCHYEFRNLQEIPDDTFYGLEVLETLDLSFNKINKINKLAFNGLSKLKYLILKVNFLEIIEENTFKSLISLENLDISYNLVKTIEHSAFDGLDNLLELNVANNNNKSTNTINIMNNNSFKGLQKLKTLKLNDNNILEINDHMFQNLTELNELDLSGNKIKEINNDSFNGLKKLEHLNLNNNFLKEIIEKPFENLLKLKTLEVSGNIIKYFNPSLKINAEFIKIFNFEYKLRYFHNYNKSLTERELRNFYGKDIISDFGTLYTINSNCFESIELLNKDYKRLKKGFKWENKNLKRLIAIIGLNGVGKTSLLELIDKSISKDHNNFISKYFDSANQKLKINHDEYSQLNIKLCSKAAEINSKNDFIDFVYQSINDFSLLQYFDYLLLIGYNYDDFNKIDKNLFQYEFSQDYINFRQAEQKYFLYRIEDKSKELSNTYYALDKQNDFQSI